LKILIAGIGDILRKDDGFGPEVVKRLEKSERLPENAVIKDYGTSSFDLLFDLKDFDEVIFVDSMEFDGDIGEIREIVPKTKKLDEEEVVRSINMSLHEIELQKIIDLMFSLDILPKNVLILGFRPKDLRMGLGLPKEVDLAVEKAQKMILEKVYGRLK